MSDRKIFSIDTGNLPKEKAEEYIKKIIKDSEHSNIPIIQKKIETSSPVPQPEIDEATKEQLRQVIQLSSETIERNMLGLMGNDNCSLSCIQLDSKFVLENFKNTKTVKWVSEEEKEKAFANELVWGLYYGENNLHASAIAPIMKMAIKI